MASVPRRCLPNKKKLRQKPQKYVKFRKHLGRNLSWGPMGSSGGWYFFTIVYSFSNRTFYGRILLGTINLVVLPGDGAVTLKAEVDLIPWKVPEATALRGHRGVFLWVSRKPGHRMASRPSF